MDEFLEHMLSMPSWSDGGGVNKNNWAYNGSSLVPGNGLNSDPTSASKNFTASTMASSLQHSNLDSHSDLVLQSKENQDNAEDQASGHLQFPLGDLLSAPYLNQRDIKASVLPMAAVSPKQSIPHMELSASLGSSGGLASQRAQGAIVPHIDFLSLHMLSEEVPSGQVWSNPSNSPIPSAVVPPAIAVAGGSINGADLAECRSVASSGSEGSAGQQATADCQSSPPIEAAWHQSYIGGVSPLPLRLGQAKSESFLAREEVTSSGANILGKYREEDGGFMRDHSLNSLAQGGSQGRLFPDYGTSQGGQRTGQPSIQPVNAISSQGQQSSPSYQGLVVHAYGSQSPASQPQPTNNLVGGAARPRVRARRGQATDPHSIAERLRRERIAERMKALQELVPNANKTDKASMLDEIIDYVKFLQLQVKVLSMSRLGGAGAIAPLVADIPSEGLAHINSTSVSHTNVTSHDGIALTERQVSRLMEEDMGSAMQYLQSKGLCLMPISLATAMSSTTTKTVVGTKITVPGVGSGDKPSIAIVPISNSLTTVSIVPALSTGGSDGCTTPKGVGGSLRDANESTAQK